MSAQCRRCGTRCQTRLCQECELDDRYSFDDRLDSHDEETTDELLYECCDCHETYRAEGAGQCPHCGNWGARYAGELEGCR